jgi:hypothetical protein
MHEVLFQIPFVIPEGHSVHAAGRFLPQQKEAGPQRFHAQMPIQVPEPVVPVSLSLVC